MEKKTTPHQLPEGLIDDSWPMIACTQTMFPFFFSTRENRGSVNRLGLLNLLEPNKSNIQNRSGSFCEKKKANYMSLFTMDLEKLLVNDKIKALRQTNMSPKDYIKYFKKQTLQNC